MCQWLRKILSRSQITGGKGPEYPPKNQQLQIGDLVCYRWGKSDPSKRVPSKTDHGMRVYGQVVTEKEFISAVHCKLTEKKLKEGYLYVDTIIGYDCLPLSDLTKITDIDTEIEAINRSCMSKQYKDSAILFIKEAK